MIDDQSGIPATFEKLWEEAETISTKIYKDKSTIDIVKSIGDLLTKYCKVEPLGMPEAKFSLQKRYMGEILFLLSVLSAKDNINIYPALQEEIISSK